MKRDCVAEAPVMEREACPPAPSVTDARDDRVGELRPDRRRRSAIHCSRYGLFSMNFRRAPTAGRVDQVRRPPGRATSGRDSSPEPATAREAAAPHRQTRPSYRTDGLREHVEEQVVESAPRP